ncbi:MAG: iron ABC transporter permease [Rhodocyclaceae bacterium]|jgi:iron complex transport system permease protein|nr:iron ABC transporter permease [Rhodocyclaceae bacterium]
MTHRRHLAVLLVLLLCAAAGLMTALVMGSLPVRPADVWAALTGGSGAMADVVLQLRLPRALGAFACGGLLALAGALMQVLLRNPLGDPYVLGISGGASVGALCALLFGLTALWINLAAFCGAFLVLLLVFGLAHGEGSWVQSRLLLTGVIVSAGCGAAVSLILSIAPDQSLHGMLFWIMGDAAYITQPLPALLVLLAGVLLVLPLARDLNVLVRGDTQAAALGVSVNALRWFTYFLAALLTSVAVATAGSIGFIGLVVPHLMRLVLGNDQRLLLPASALGGGTLLVLADTLARTVIAPQQLPVGVLTALIGVPLFLYLLARQGRSA